MAEELSAQVVIVGAGVAGGLAAAKLAEAGVDLLVLEAGPRITRAQAVAAYDSAPQRGVPESPYPNSPYAPHPLSRDPDFYYIQEGPAPFAAGYERIVGGTTWHWQGTSVRLLPDDFRLKSRFGRGLDWPIDYGELEPWYAEAERELGVAGDSDHDLGAPRSAGYPLPAMPLSFLDQQIAAALAGTPYAVSPTPQSRNTVDWNGRPTCCGSASCIPICPTGAKYDALVHLERAEAAGARILAQAVVHRIELDEQGRVAGLAFKRPDGSEGRARAQVFVLAAHGIETPKLLLISRGPQAPEGVANRSGQVGRNLMDHPHQLSWALSKEPLWPFRGPVNLSGIEGPRRGQWRASRPAYRVVIGNNGWSWATGAPVSTARDFIRAGLRGRALAQAVYHHTARQISLMAMIEELPDPENRIQPDFERRDAIGIPRPRISYRRDAYTRAGLAEAKRVHQEIFELIGTSESHHRDDGAAGGHIMGTTRMGDDPRHAVVDRDLRAHDHANLFLLGSGVFPTGGATNPTLTIAALSLRAVAPIMASLRS